VKSIVCDLDGVVYRGDQVIPGSSEALHRLHDSGFKMVFATNNSSRTPEHVAGKLESVAGVIVPTESIVTSAQAGVAVLPPEVDKVFVVGGRGISQAVEDSGRTCVTSGAEAVIVGLDFEFNYQSLTAAADQVRGGALFIASNSDATYPGSSGLLPGAGAMVSAIATASGVTPISAGKPEAPMRKLIRDKGVGEAWVVGDRVDTDIRMATEEPDWRSVLVLTGVTRPGDDHSEADFVVADLAAAVDLVLAAPDRQ
jgi:glycerol-1-phosphatase